MPAHTPPGWPEEVLPADVEGWETTALAWLLDYGDPAWRLNEALTRHPVVLATAARHRAHADVAAARQLWHDHIDPGAGLEPETAAAVRALLEREGPRLAARARAVDLVAEALRGRRWVPRL